MSRLLTTREVADEFRVDPETVRAWVRRRELPAIRIGRGPKAGLRFTRQALDAYLAKRQTTRPLGG